MVSSTGAGGAGLLEVPRVAAGLPVLDLAEDWDLDSFFIVTRSHGASAHTRLEAGNGVHSLGAGRGGGRRELFIINHILKADFEDF